MPKGITLEDELLEMQTMGGRVDPPSNKKPYLEEVLQNVSWKGQYKQD